MTVLDIIDYFLLVVFVVFVAYRLIKKNRNKKTFDNLNADSKTSLEFQHGTIKEIFVNSVDIEKTDTPKLIAFNVSQTIENYFDDLDALGKTRPTDIDFITNYNRIFIVYKWK